jgi:PAS domain S-box-containing protein
MAPAIDHFDRSDPPAVKGGHHLTIDNGEPGPDNHRSELFYAAVEATRMPMVLTNPRLPDNPIIFANNAFISMTGYDPEEILGRNCRFLQGPRTDPAAVTEVRNAVEQQKEVSVELINYKKDGTEFWNALFLSPVFDHNRELQYFFASQLDVSRRRIAEDALSQAKKMEALGQLTGGMAHDFNNILQVVIGHMDRMQKKLANVTDPSVMQSLDYALTAAEKGATLTQQLLSFARRQRLEQHTVNLNELLASIGELSERTIGREIKVEYQLDQNLRNAKADAAQTESAILNLIINARDAMPQGGTLTFRTSNWPPEKIDKMPPQAEALIKGHYVCISVQDTGTGIPAEIIGRVTDPFFTTKEQGKGTGLGLSVAYGFMRQSGGTLFIESQVGVGTTVNLLFPASTDLINRDSSGHTIMDQQGFERILVVEDQAEVMFLTRTILEESGYKVTMATSAAEALKVVESGLAFDLLLSDVVMPGGMNGDTLAKEVVRMRPGMKVLLTTGYSGANATVEKPLGYPIISKPYRSSNLLRMIREVIDA